MSKTAILMVPSQGKSVGSFLAVAKVAKARFYPRATIIKTVVTHGDLFDSVVLANADTGVAFDWANVAGIDSFVTLTHGWIGDGHNLAYEDGQGGSQPWGSGDHDGSLSSDGRAFWGAVGNAMKPNGKIVFFGCKLGAGLYASNAARAADRVVYASTEEFGAGHPDTVVRHLAAIEDGKLLRPMVKFLPV